MPVDFANMPAPQRDFWSTQPTMAPMMSKEEKHQLSDSGITFDVVSIKDATSVEYGDFWAVEISRDGNRSVIAFGMDTSNESRNNQFREMQDWFNAGHGAIPSTLVSFRTKTGFTAYALQPPGTRYAQQENPEYGQSVGSGDDSEPPF